MNGVVNHMVSGTSAATAQLGSEPREGECWAVRPRDRRRLRWQPKVREDRQDHVAVRDVADEAERLVAESMPRPRRALLDRPPTNRLLLFTTLVRVRLALASAVVRGGAAKSSAAARAFDPDRPGEAMDGLHSPI
jgi:hypothetical protein